MAHRADLNSLTPGARQALVNLMLQYITDAVVANHLNINHSGLDLFVGHRAYIVGMEAFLSARGSGQFVPLPMWNPINPIPPEFNVVKARDNGTARPPLQNLTPNVSLPAQFEFSAVCAFRTGSDLGNAINGWHGGVHIAIGGTMSDITIASAAPIFWCWHAYLDHVYWDWERCIVAPQPPVTPPHVPPAEPPAEEPPSEGVPTPEMYGRWYDWYQRAYPKLQKAYRKRG